MKIKTFFDNETFTLTYIVWDEDTKKSIIIDPVLNYEPATSTISFESINQVISFIKINSLSVNYTIETHAHADHLSGAQEIKKAFPKVILGIGHKIIEVQKTFKNILNLDKTFPTDGSQFDKLFDSNESFEVGSLKIRIISTPGHTPACCSYLVNDSVFTGDALFMPDYGTARCDFPAGSSSDLYDSITKNLYSLPDNIKTFTCHDYQPNGRELKYESTIGEQKKNNIQLSQKVTKQEFIKFRDKKDSDLKAPRLLLPSIQVNIKAGLLPEKESNEIAYLKIPLNIQEEK
jgi:glyoxylase-like metal-dependent hydrolase (beta-lactamase superfamily II)